eukprot:TRINITY_DN2729_c0_g1_i2.p1 TRINITY_DN2729_c0_g1~~TRINITY_DN2729_c0_g1_i2.p1  ORF type:complete len:496 (-),score=121.25 TRINITY_DN2729_c0_g1_i2:184-1671(-)
MTLAATLAACDSLAAVLQPTFGPNGSSVLCISVGGAMLITRSATDILRTVEIEHPGARIVVDAAQALAKRVGDGTKSFVFMCAGALKQSVYELSRMRSGQAVLAQRVSVLAAQVQQYTDAVLLRAAGTPADGHVEHIETAACLIRTLLSGITDGPVTSTLQKLALQMAFHNGTDTLGSTCHTLLRDWPVTAVAGAALSASVLLKGVVVHGRLLRTSMRPHGSNLRCMVVRAYAATQTSVASHANAFTDIVGQFDVFCREVVEELVRSDIRLVLVTGAAAPAAFVAYAAAAGIAVSDIDKDAATRICTLFHVEPQLLHVLQPKEHPNSIVVLESYRVLDVGGVSCLHLTTDACQTTHLMLRAPALGTAQQFSTILKRCIMTLRNWIAFSQTIVIGSGLCAEILLQTEFNSLADAATREQDLLSAAAFRIAAASCEAPVEMLVPWRQRMKLVQAVRALHVEGNSHAGLVATGIAQRLTVSDTVQSGLIEPAWNKYVY